MAGDWIKMRNNLWDDPRVSRLCDLTDEREACVIGSLYWLWAMADEHTEDGHLPGLTLAGIDRKTGLKGFGAGLVEVGWLIDGTGGVTIVRFDEHNGTSAKRRCTDAQRKANSRSLSASDADTTRTDGGQDAPKGGEKTPNLGAREEKRREEQRASDADASAPGASPPAAGQPTNADSKPGEQLSKPTLTPDEIIFSYGVPILTVAGSTDKAARSFLAGLRKEHGDVPLVDALRDCIKAKPLQPLEWLAKALPPKGGKTSKHAGFASKNYREGVDADGSFA